MKKFTVMAMATNAAHGVGPVQLDAIDAADAKERFAEAEGMTLAGMESAGLVVMAEEAS